MAQTLPLPTPTEAAAPVVRLEGAPRQGGILFVTIRAMSTGPAHCTWLGKTYPVVSLPGEADVLRVVLPVPMEAKPGKAWLHLEIPGGGEAWHSVVVRTHPFATQSIWLPAATVAGYDSPRAKQEDALLLGVIGRFDPEKHWRGSFARPCGGAETTAFGIRRTYNGRRKDRHRGVDVAVGNGTRLRAPNGGVVGMVAPGMRVNGNALVINHGLGVASLYLHASRYYVKTGQRMAKGEVFAATGSSGAATGPHLHWACYVHGVPVDPAVLRHVPAGW